jgi:hypothetical protein
VRFVLHEFMVLVRLVLQMVLLLLQKILLLLQRVRLLLQNLGTKNAPAQRTSSYYFSVTENAHCQISAVSILYL